MLFWLGITIRLIFLVYNKPEKMMPICIIYFFVTVINDIFLMSVLELANAFGVSYQLGDMMMLLFVSPVIIDLFKQHLVKKNINNALLTFFTTLLLFNMIQGLSDFGLTSEWFGDVRTLLRFWGAMIWGKCFFNVAYAKKYMRMLDIVMTIIVIITFVLWGLDLGLGFHPLPSQYYATLSDGGSTMRFIQSYEVFGITLYALYLARKSISYKGLLDIKAIVYLGIVVLFQHRSIWMAMALGIIVIIWSEFTTNKCRAKLLMQIIAVVVGSAAFMMFSQGDLASNISKSWEVFMKLITGKKVENSTATTRTQVWNATLEDLNGISLIAGRPFGYGYAKSIGWQTSPHSGYVRFLARTGYCGFISFLLIGIGALIRTIKKFQYIPEFVACVIGFMYGYDGTWLCGLIIGIALSIYTKP